MAREDASPRTRGPECAKSSSIREQILSRWAASGLSRQGARIDVAVDVGGNQLILTGTVRAPDDRDQAVALAAVDPLQLLIVDRINVTVPIAPDEAL